MTEIPQHLQKDHRAEIGSHIFTEEDILRYTKKFVPADIHTCTNGVNRIVADGLHVASVWMSLQRTYIKKTTQKLQKAGETYAAFGPSPGVEYMNWPNQVMAGDTVTYQNHIQEIRPSNSRPNWWIMTNKVTGRNQNNAIVMEFQSTAFVTLKK